MSRRSSQSGFTLLELMMGVAVTSIILAAVAAAVIAVSGAYNNEAQIKGAVEGGRTAIAFLERNLRMAGYGIEPQYAFDFTAPTAGKDNYSLGGAGAFVTDDLAFRYRDPSFLRRGSYAGGNLTLNNGGASSSTTWGAAFPKGTAIMLACPGAKERAWYRINDASGVTATGSTASLTSYTGNNAPTDMSLSCAGQGGAASPYVFILREFRVRLFKSGERAYLMAVTNLSDSIPDATTIPANAEPLAADVEEFQVAYVMNRPAINSAAGATVVDSAGNGNWILMDTSGESLPSTASTAPRLEDAYDSINRFNSHPANIRAVRVNLSLRSARKENNRRQAFFRTPMENSTTTAATTGDGYFRTWLTSTVRTPNLTSRSFFLPPLTQGPGDNLNVNGG